jgi:hypothetical protein
MYVYIFVALPLTQRLYNILEPIISKITDKKLQIEGENVNEL